jgi:hypothetical protein
MSDDDDTIPSSSKRASLFAPDTIDETTDHVLAHVVGEATAAVIKLTEIMGDTKDLLSQLTRLAQDIQSARALHKSSMIPNARVSVDVE